MREIKTERASIRIFPTKQELIDGADAYCASVLRERIAQRGRCSIALSGGSTPKPLYEKLARRSDIDWARVYVYFVDERNVPPEHPDSNYGMIDRALLTPAKVPRENIHRMRGELPAAESATEYESALRANFGPEALPRFDLILLGMGPDGHTASLFPGTPALHERTAWVASNPVEKLHTDRITLTLPAIENGAHIVFLIAGEDKSQKLAAALAGASEDVPASLVAPRDGTLLWLVDESAYGAAPASGGS